MTPDIFIPKWHRAELRERQSYMEHFLDVCRLVGHPTPADMDPEGSRFCFDRKVEHRGGELGFADVWKKDFFVWEYKGRKHKDVHSAYRQLLSYHEPLGNPPLLVVCDTERFFIYPKFTGLVTIPIEIKLFELRRPEAIAKLRAVFHEPDRLKPEMTFEGLTRTAVEHLVWIADRLRTRPLDAERVAHFLMKVVFCAFAQDKDIGLLPVHAHSGQGVLTSIVEIAGEEPERFTRNLRMLFEAMEKGGDFWGYELRPFNGRLFADHEVINLDRAELQRLRAAARLPWAQIEPSIFGTLFERCIDPDQRTKLGLHYTDPADIRSVIEPVLVAPLRQEWDAVEREVRALSVVTGEAREAGAQAAPKPGKKRARASALFAPQVTTHQIRERLAAFIKRLGDVRVLDPACGSGNFLYLALHALLDLEREAVALGIECGVTDMPNLRCVGPHQLLGIEINPFAHELASIVVWIGQIKWTRDYGFQYDKVPVLDVLDTIRLGDAILDRDEHGNPCEPQWPQVDVIIGNPPFLGGKKLRTGTTPWARAAYLRRYPERNGSEQGAEGLGDSYVEALFTLWRERVPPEADLCVYWHEKARAQIAAGRAKRAGLLATQAIRGGANRVVLQRIKDSGAIFEAWSDREWTLDGAAVHISIVCQDDGREKARRLDGAPVSNIHADLTAGDGADLTRARKLAENAKISFMGTTKQGPFEIDRATAEKLWAAQNPDGRSNRDVVRPWRNGKDITGRAVDHYIIDLDALTMQEAMLYEAPFEYVRKHVKPWREDPKRKRAWFREQWWQLYARRPQMYDAINGKTRFLITPRVAKHRLFAWLTPDIVPDCQLIVFAHDDDFFFGVLHSKVHEWWALATGSQVREKESGFRYTPTTCFEKFPFPWPPKAARLTINQRAHEKAIAAAAAELDRLRTGWLNPPGMEAKELKKRTLTNLYNQRPAWLGYHHAVLDRAVLAAYGWDDLADAVTARDEDREAPDGAEDAARAELLHRLLMLNRERAEADASRDDKEP